MKRKPLPSRTDARPLLLTDTGPIRFDTEAPDFDRFAVVPRPNRFRLPHINPMC